MSPRVLDAVNWRSVKAYFEWEFSHELTNGWSYLFSFVGYAGLSVLFLGLRDVLSVQFMRLLLPGVVVAFALRPFLRIGQSVAHPGVIPRKFLSSPVPSSIFLVNGFVSRLIKMITGMGVFLGLMALMSFPLAFLSSGTFWGVFVIILPGAVGLGGLISVAQATAGTDDSFRWWMELILDVVGGVFFRPELLPPGLSFLSFLTPHYYVIQQARFGLSTTWVAVALVLSLCLCFVGGFLLVVTLKQKIAGGQFHRVT